MLRPFTIHQPQSVAAAANLVREHGDDAAFYAGGTELLIVLKEHLAQINHLVDIKRVPGLQAISLSGDGENLVIGALATHRTIERNPLVRERLPALAALEAQVANVRVRAAGTLGGNLCFADPHSDPATLLAALGATLTLDNGNEQRAIPAETFTVALMTTERQPDELLTQISIPLPAAGVGVGYERIKLHERPTAAVAAAIEVAGDVIASARVVAGCVGDAPQRLAEVETALVGLPANASSANRVKQLIARTVETYDTVFESAAYKRQLASAVGAKAIAAAITDATGSGMVQRVA